MVTVSPLIFNPPPAYASQALLPPPPPPACFACAGEEGHGQASTSSCVASHRCLGLRLLPERQRQRLAERDSAGDGRRTDIALAQISGRCAILHALAEGG